MCELCKKRVASDINNRNADTILKLSEAARTLYEINAQTASNQVVDALIKLLPQEAKTSGDTYGQAEPANQATDGGSNPDYKGDPRTEAELEREFIKLIARALGIDAASVRTVFVRA